MDNDKVIYELTIADIQNVAEQELDRKLKESELNLIINKLDNYIEWYSAIEVTIRSELSKKENNYER